MLSSITKISRNEHDSALKHGSANDWIALVDSAMLCSTLASTEAGQLNASVVSDSVSDIQAIGAADP